MKQSLDNALRQLMREVAESTHPARSWEEVEGGVAADGRSPDGSGRRGVVSALAVAASAVVVVGGIVAVSRNGEDDPLVVESPSNDSVESRGTGSVASSTEPSTAAAESVPEGPSSDEPSWPPVATPADLRGLSEHVVAVDTVEGVEERKLLEFGADEGSVYEYWGTEADVIRAPESSPVRVGDRITLVRLVHQVTVLDPETGETQPLPPAQGYAEPLDDDGYVVGVARDDRLEDDGAWVVVAGQNGLVSIVRDGDEWVVASRDEEPLSALERALDGEGLDAVMRLFER